MKTVSFQLESLTCPSCIKKIESTLNKISGIDSVRVMFNSSKVKATFDEALIEVNKIEEIIKKLGYPVLSAKVS